MTQAVLQTRPQAESPDTGISREVWVANALTGVLSDSYVLMIKTQGYHWNVVGPLFQPIHDLTEQHYRDLFEAIDVIAERIRALGQIAPMAFTDLITHAALSEEQSNRSAAGMVEQLIADHEQLTQRLRETARLAASQGDGGTEDLMNSRLAFHEKALWMLRAIVAK